MPSSPSLRRALAALLLVPALAACGAKTDAPASGGSNTPAPATSTAPTQTDAPSQTPTPSPTPRVTSTKNLTVNYFGDSFAVGARPGLDKVFKHVELFAKVSEQSDAVLTDMRNHAKDPVDVVVLHTGNNGTINPESLKRTLADLKHVPRVVVVLPRTPRPWTKQARETLVQVCGTEQAPLIDNVRVVDWNAFVEGHDDEYLVKDKVHPNAKGIAAYTKLIQQAVARP